MITGQALPARGETSAARRECESMTVEPQINFTTSYGKLVYDFSLSKNELSRIARQAGIFEKGVFAAGLALVNINSEYELSTETRATQSNERCIVPVGLNVYIGFSRPIIYLAKELQHGTCSYNLVLRHEQVHQQINVQALQYFIPMIRRELNAAAAKIPAVYVGPLETEDKALEQLNRRYAEIITPQVNRLRSQILAEQRKLDNSRNYKMEGDVCRKFNRKSR